MRAVKYSEFFYRFARYFYKATKRILGPAVRSRPRLHRFVLVVKEASKDFLRPPAVVYNIPLQAKPLATDPTWEHGRPSCPGIAKRSAGMADRGMERNPRNRTPALSGPQHRISCYHRFYTGIPGRKALP